MSDSQSKKAAALDKLISTAKIMGVGAVSGQVLKIIRKKSLEILSKHEPEKVREYISCGTPLVYNKTNDRVAQLLYKAGSNFPGLFHDKVHAEQFLAWMKDPHWLPDEAEEERQRLQEMAQIIEEEPMGRRWLQQQCAAIHDIAGVAEQ